MATNYEIDMTEGSLTKNIIRYSVPLLLTNILQLLYNAADIIVVGRFVGTHALAAVGAAGALINLIINLFVGMSVGVSVLVSRYYGAKEYNRLSKVVQTSFFASIILGIVCMIIGEILSRRLLLLMGTPADVLSETLKYVKCYFVGIPGSLVFNFCAAVLRAVGDTKRPLYILSLSGIVNVILNLILVASFNFGVEGVAVATTVANYLSAALVIYFLHNSYTPYRLHINKFIIDKNELKNIFVIGLPAGINGTVFSLSNAVIQSAINSFGASAVAGCTASSNIESFVYTAMNSVHHGALTAASQNFGAKNKKRIKKTLSISVILVIAIGIITGGVAILFKKPLIGFYTSDPDVMKYAEIRLTLVCSIYFLCGVMDVLVGYLRGIGFSVTPMIVSMLGACGFRIVWISTAFKQFNSIPGLMASWPLSWILVITADIVIILTAGKRRVDKHIGG